MNHPFDDAFAKLEAPTGLDSSKASQQRRWEHKVVGKIISHFGLNSAARAIAAEAAESAGFRALTFEAFKKTFPSFPVWLAARKVDWAWQTTVEDIVGGFRKTKIFKAFEEAEDEAPESYQGVRFGLVFEWLKVWPVAIIHNYYHASRDTGTIITHYQASKDVRFAVQSFDSFLGSLPWTPN